MYVDQTLSVCTEPQWVDLTQKADEDFTPVPWEDNLTYWEVLAELISSEPPFDQFRAHYGDLAELGIARGHPFAPDERMRGILTRAAVMGHAQPAAQSFADRRPDREVWPGTRWEWAVLRPENSTFDTPYYADVYARQKWFYLAQIESPAMFARHPGAGSLYWLCTRDTAGAYLDGGGSHTLDVPQSAPAKLFWSITVYDARTSSEIRTSQGTAAIRSLFELADTPTDRPVAAGLTHPHGRPARACRRAPRSAGRATAALPQRPPHHLPPLRPPVGPPRPVSPLGTGAADQHALDPAHDPDLGRKARHS